MSLWGKQDRPESIPNFLNDVDSSNAYLLDVEEASESENRSKGLKTSGWNLYRTYTDASGSIRNKVECLVAMGITNEEAGDNDALKPLSRITITTQPINLGDITEGGTATYFVEASSDLGANLTYQWQKSEEPSGYNFTNIANATDTSYTTDVLTVSNDGERYRVLVSAVGAVESILSSIVTLSVVPS